jgi:hypothetical protein
MIIVKTGAVIKVVRLVRVLVVSFTRSLIIVSLLFYWVLANLDARFHFCGKGIVSD